jgi:hypothetical protein
MFRLPLIDVQRDECDMNKGAEAAENFCARERFFARSSAAANRAAREFDPSAGAGYDTVASCQDLAAPLRVGFAPMTRQAT